MGLVASAGAQVAKHVAPAAGGGIVREVLERAIDGAGPFPGAAKSADAALRNAGGDAERAIDALITQHQRLAGAQGFLTNIGGLLTAAVTIPLNIAGVMVLQCRLAAAILHLRGYDLAKPSVRDAVLVSLLDSDARTSLSKSTGVTIKPESVAALDVPPGARAEIAKEVAGEILALAGGKQIARFFARRIPILGGVIGGFGDARATKRIGRDTARIAPKIVVAQGA